MATDSLWGRAVATLTDPAPATGAADSEWGRAVVTLDEGGIVRGDSAWGRATVTLGAFVTPPTNRATEPGDVITLTASASAPASAWSWRQISGPPAVLVGTGDTRQLQVPGVMPPNSTTVVIGVSATIGGSQTAEVTCTITAPPQLMWYLAGDGTMRSLFRRRPPVNDLNTMKIALIGDSTMYQDGAGEAKFRTLLNAKGFLTANIFFYARGGKPIGYADDQGYTTLQNMAQARAAIGEPDIWVFNLGSNGHRDGDANNTGWINAVLDSAGTSGRVLWVGISQVTGYAASDSPSSEATRLHWNDIARPLVQARTGGNWLDWHAYVKSLPGGDASLWSGDGVHMTTAGYTVKNQFTTDRISS